MEVDTLKLFMVNVNTHGELSCAYVVASNPDKAYKIYREFIDKEGLMFAEDRELESVQLIAECCGYPECKTILFVEGMKDGPKRSNKQETD